MTRERLNSRVRSTEFNESSKNRSEREVCVCGGATQGRCDSLRCVWQFEADSTGGAGAREFTAAEHQWLAPVSIHHFIQSGSVCDESCFAAWPDTADITYLELTSLPSVYIPPRPPPHPHLLLLLQPRRSLILSVLSLGLGLGLVPSLSDSSTCLSLWSPEMNCGNLPRALLSLCHHGNSRCRYSSQANFRGSVNTLKTAKAFWTIPGFKWWFEWTSLSTENSSNDLHVLVLDL